jgi:hypothetical protein
MDGKQMTGNYIKKVINNMKIFSEDKGKWPAIELDIYLDMVNKLDKEADEISKRLSDTIEMIVLNKEAQIRSMLYYLSQHQLPVQYREQIEESIRKTEKEAFLIGAPLNGRFMKDLTRMFIEFIIYDYYERKKGKKWKVDVFNERAGLKLSFGQHPSTPDTTFRKQELLLRDFSSPDTRVLFLGDYDSGCLALKTLADFEVHMLDLDRDVIRFVESKNMGIITHIVNLKKGVPGDLQNYFDAIVLDPFWTINGTEMFLHSAYACMKKDNRSRMYVTICPYVMGDDYGTFQRLILDKGLIFLEIIKHFAWYILRDSKNYSELVDLFVKLNEDHVRSELFAGALNMPTCFADMHVLGINPQM